MEGKLNEFRLQPWKGKTNFIKNFSTIAIVEELSQSLIRNICITELILHLQLHSTSERAVVEVGKDWWMYVQSPAAQGGKIFCPNPIRLITWSRSHRHTIAIFQWTSIWCINYQICVDFPLSHQTLVITNARNFFIWTQNTTRREFSIKMDIWQCFLQALLY